MPDRQLLFLFPCIKSNYHLYLIVGRIAILNWCDDAVANVSKSRQIERYAQKSSKRIKCSRLLQVFWRADVKLVRSVRHSGHKSQVSQELNPEKRVKGSFRFDFQLWKWAKTGLANLSCWQNFMAGVHYKSDSKAVFYVTSQLLENCKKKLSLCFRVDFICETDLFQHINENKSRSDIFSWCLR